MIFKYTMCPHCFIWLYKPGHKPLSVHGQTMNSLIYGSLRAKIAFNWFGKPDLQTTQANIMNYKQSGLSSICKINGICLETKMTTSNSSRHFFRKKSKATMLTSHNSVLYPGSKRQLPGISLPPQYFKNSTICSKSDSFKSWKQKV